MKYFFLLGIFLFVDFQARSAAPTLVTIAIIDTGIDIDHPYLKSDIWQNAGELGLDNHGHPRATNGIDDDHDGYIDDVHGWNFTENNHDIQDRDGHGTHIGGLIKKTISEKNADLRFEFMVLKYAASKNVFARALNYAIDHDADIINISGGGSGFNYEERKALERAAKLGISVVASAGNKIPGQKDISFYPAAYSLSNIYSVVATDQTGQVLATSNINQNKNNFFVSGRNIYSTLPHNQYGYKTGSSQATAILTGTLALRTLIMRTWN